MKNTSLYVIEFDSGIKIGITTELKRRVIDEYKKPWCQPVKQGIVFHNLSFPRRVETQLKAFYKEHTIIHSTEFFINLSYKDLLNKILQISKEIEYENKRIKFGKHNVSRALNYETINFNFPKIVNMTTGYNY